MMRKIGIIFTLISFLVGGAFVLYLFISMTQHARIDSEGGTFFYGLAMLIYLTATMLGILVGSIMWGIGIRKARRNVVIKRAEVIFQRLFILASSLWIGFVVYHLVVTNL